MKIFRSKLELYESAKKNIFLTKQKVKSEDPELFLELEAKYPDVTFGEQVWCFVQGVDLGCCEKCRKRLIFDNISTGYKECVSCKHENKNIIPERTVCEMPGCENLVRKGKYGWLKYCSKSCQNTHNSLKSREKAKATYFEKTGYEYALQNPEVVDSMRKENLKKFGFSNVASVPEFREKRHQTCLEKYGVISSFSDPEKRQKIVDDVASRYGYEKGTFEFISQIPEIHSKKLATGYNSYEYELPSGKIITIQGYENKFYDLVLKKYDEELFCFDEMYIPYYLDDNLKVYHPDGFFRLSETVIEVKSRYTLLKDIEKNIEKSRAVINEGKNITFFVPGEKDGDYFNFVNLNKSLFEIVDSIDVEVEILKEIDGYVLSCYFPESKVGIYTYDPAFNIEGIVPKDYLYKMKMKLKESGISILIVSSKDLDKKAWRNTIISKIGLSSNRIYARQCNIKKVTVGSDNFLNEYHIQGKSSTTIKYGLYYNNDLVALMSFSESSKRHGVGKNRGEGAYELVRYATSSSIVGGASKLLRHFERTHNPRLVYSYSDNDVSDGNLYGILGFSLENEYCNDYFYYSPFEQVSKHRFSLSKNKLKEKYSHYDDNLTGDQIAELNGFLKVRKSGKKTWVKKYDN